MNNIDLVGSLAEAFMNNILITAVSCIIPLFVGIVVYCLLKTFENKTFSRIIRFPSIIFESVCPLIVLFFVYFGIPYISRQLGFRIVLTPTMGTLIGFTICFIGYMPARYNSKDSLVKNWVVNSLGLFSTVLKWSFVSSVIGAPELTNKIQNYIAISFKSFEWWACGLIVTLVVIFIVELLKYIANEVLE